MVRTSSRFSSKEQMGTFEMARCVRLEGPGSHVCEKRLWHTWWIRRKLRNKRAKVELRVQDQSYDEIGLSRKRMRKRFNGDSFLVYEIFCRYTSKNFLSLSSFFFLFVFYTCFFLFMIDSKERRQVRSKENETSPPNGSVLFHARTRDNGLDFHASRLRSSCCNK